MTELILFHPLIYYPRRITYNFPLDLMFMANIHRGFSHFTGVRGYQDKYPGEGAVVQLGWIGHGIRERRVRRFWLLACEGRGHLGPLLNKQRKTTGSPKQAQQGFRVRGNSREKLGKQFFRLILRAGCDLSSCFCWTSSSSPQCLSGHTSTWFFLLPQSLQLLHWLYLIILLQLFPFSLPWKQFKSFSKLNSSLTVLPWQRMCYHDRGCFIYAVTVNLNQLTVNLNSTKSIPSDCNYN